MALLAAQAQEPFFQRAALQVGLELLCNIAWQYAARLGAQLPEGWIVLLDEPFLFDAVVR